MKANEIGFCKNFDLTKKIGLWYNTFCIWFGIHAVQLSRREIYRHIYARYCKISFDFKVNNIRGLPFLKMDILYWHIKMKKIYIYIYIYIYFRTFKSRNVNFIDWL